MKTTSFASTIRQIFKPTIGWMRDHPLKSCGFASLFTFLADLIAVCNPVPFVIVFVICLTWFGFVLSRDLRRKAIAGLVMFCLFSEGVPIRAQEKPREEAGAAVATIVVLVVGGVVFIYVVRFCQRHFPPPPPPANTNNPPITVAATGDLPDDYAATWTYYPYVSCEIAPANAGLPTTEMRLTGTFVPTDSGLDLRLDAQKIAPRGLVDGPTFQRLVQAHGVYVSAGVGQKLYGHNGQPATETEVPIYFWEEDHQHNVSFVTGGEPVPLAIERSSDLAHWETLTSVTVSAGQRIGFHDTSVSEQMFYRFRRL